MPASENARYQIGERVHDRQTGRDGRVVGMVALAGGAVLVTVGFFIGRRQVGEAQEVVRAGQVAGLRFERLEQAGEALGRAARATTELLGVRSSTGSAAEQLARQNLPPAPSAHLSRADISEIRNRILREHRGMLETPRGHPAFPSEFEQFWRRVLAEAQSIERADSRYGGRLTQSLKDLRWGSNQPSRITVLGNVQGAQELRFGGGRDGVEDILRIATGQNRATFSVPRTGPLSRDFTGREIPGAPRAVPLSHYEDPAALAERVFGMQERAGELLRIRQGQKDELDELLRFLTKRGQGGYYQEVLRDRNLSHSRFQQLVRRLGDMKIPPELRRHYKLPATAETVYDLLRNAHGELDRVRLAGGNVLQAWEHESALLARVFRQSEPYRRSGRHLERLHRFLDRASEHHNLLAHQAESQLQASIYVDPEVGRVYEPYWADRPFGNALPDPDTGRFVGRYGELVGLDPDLRAEAAALRSGIRVQRGGSAGTRAGRHARLVDLDPLYLGRFQRENPGQPVVGRIVRGRGGAPFRIVGVTPGQHVQLRPVQAPLQAWTSRPFSTRDEFDLWETLRSGAVGEDRLGVVRHGRVPLDPETRLNLRVGRTGEASVRARDLLALLEGDASVLRELMERRDGALVPGSRLKETLRAFGVVSISEFEERGRGLRFWERFLDRHRQTLLLRRPELDLDVAAGDLKQAIAEELTRADLASRYQNRTLSQLLSDLQARGSAPEFIDRLIGNEWVAPEAASAAARSYPFSRDLSVSQLRRRRDLAVLYRTLQKAQEAGYTSVTDETRELFVRKLGLKRAERNDPKRVAQRIRELELDKFQDEGLVEARIQELRAAGRTGPGAPSTARDILRQRAAEDRALQGVWQPVDLENPAVRELYDLALEQAEREGPETLPESLRSQLVESAEGRFQFRFAGGPEGETLFYGRGQLASPSDPHRVRHFGDAAEDQLLSPESFARHTPESWFRSKQAFYERGVRESLTRDALQPALTESGALTLFRSGERAVGFHSTDLTPWKHVRRNTLQLGMGQAESFISLDLETVLDGARRGEITNVAAVRYVKQDGRYVRAPELLDLATPELWNSHQQAEHAAKLARALQAGETFGPAWEELRTFRKNGHAVRIGAVLQDEREVIRRTVDFLHHQGGLVAGHNLSFDIRALYERAEALGMDADLPAIRALGHRTADTLLLAQAALPGRREYGLDYLSRTELGRVWENGQLQKEAHIARPDAELAADLVNHLQDTRFQPEVYAALHRARQEQLAAGTLLWDRQERRAYRFEGVIDPRGAEQELSRLNMELGQPHAALESRFGMGLRRVDFRTGRAAGPLEFALFRTPHGFAHAMAGRFQVLQEGAVQETLASTAEDLAGRRVRRMLAGTNSFEEFLLERQRFQVVTGAQTVSELQARMQSAPPAQRDILARTQRWLEVQGQDSRILRAVELEQKLWAGELAQHAPVADALEQWLGSASRERLPQAYAEASEVWNSYLSQVGGLLGPDQGWAARTHVPIVAEDRSLSVLIPELGKNRYRLRIGSQELLEQSMARLHLDVARKLGPERLASLLGDPESEAPLRALLADRRLQNHLIDTPIGQEVQERLWHNVVRPAMERDAFVQVQQETMERFRLRSTSRADALQELLTRGNQVASTMAERIPDYLQSRALVAGELQALQARVMEGGVDAALNRARGPQPFQFTHFHAVPSDWVNRSPGQLLAAAKSLDESAQNSMRDSLAWTTRRLAETERREVERAVQQHMPHWWDELFGAGAAGHGKAPPAYASFASILGDGAAEMVEEASQGARREFQAKGVQAVAIQAADLAAEHEGLLQKVGVGAAALLGTSLLVAGVTAAVRHTAQPEEEGFRSDAEAVEKRKRTLEKRTPQTHRVRISISAEDPTGADPHELTQSIHEALGSHFQKPVKGTPQVQDRRRKVDRNFLTELAGQLLSSNSRPNTRA